MAAEHRSCERFQRTELKQQRLKTQTAYTWRFSQRIQQNRQGRSLMRSCRDDSSTCNLEVQCMRGSCDNIRKWTLRSHESQALARVRHCQIAFTNLQQIIFRKDKTGAIWRKPNSLVGIAEHLMNTCTCSDQVSFWGRKRKNRSWSWFPRERCIIAEEEIAVCAYPTTFWDETQNTVCTDVARLPVLVKMLTLLFSYSAVCAWQFFYQVPFHRTYTYQYERERLLYWYHRGTRPSAQSWTVGVKLHRLTWSVPALKSC